MNPLLSDFLGSILRHGLTTVAGALVAYGVLTPAQSTTMVAGFVVFLLGWGWSLWQKYAAHSKLLAALAVPSGTTLTQLNTMPVATAAKVGASAK